MALLKVFLVLLALSIIPMLLVAGRAYFKHRGTRVVTCPETDSPAAVRVDAGRIMASSSIGEPDLRLVSCSRWPERKLCGQPCLAQIEAAPAECVVRTTLVEWYQNSSCGLCGKDIGEIHWVEHKPALLTPDRKMVEWEEISPEQIAQVMATHQRVCWRCHVSNSMRERFPGFQAEHAPSRAS